MSYCRGINSQDTMPQLAPLPSIRQNYTHVNDIEKLAWHLWIMNNGLIPAVIKFMGNDGGVYSHGSRHLNAGDAGRSGKTEPGGQPSPSANVAEERGRL